MLGDKQNVAFDDLAKLHQLGLVISVCFSVLIHRKINIFNVL